MTNDECSCNDIKYTSESGQTDPVIIIHNKTAFADYDTAMTSLNAKTLSAGELAIVYYLDATAAGGISCIIAAGPIEEGGTKQIFKNANQIDELATYLQNQINAQDTNIKNLTKQMQDTIIADTNTIKDNIIIDNAKTLDASITAFETVMNASLIKLNTELRSSIEETYNESKGYTDTQVSLLNTSINSVHTYVDNTSVYLEGEIKKTSEKLTQQLNSVLNGYSESDSSMVNYIDREDTSVYNAALEKITETSTFIGNKVDNLINSYNSHITEESEYRTALNTSINSSLNTLNTSINESIRLAEESDSSLVRYSDTQDTSLYNALNQYINDSSSNANDKITAVSNSLNEHIESNTEYFNDLNTSINTEFGRVYHTISDTVSEQRMIDSSILIYVNTQDREIGTDYNNKIHDTSVYLDDKIDDVADDLHDYTVSNNEKNELLNTSINRVYNDLNTSINYNKGLTFEKLEILNT